MNNITLPDLTQILNGK